jgi:hypothetical protein
MNARSLARWVQFLTPSFHSGRTLTRLRGDRSLIIDRIAILEGDAEHAVK